MMLDLATAERLAGIALGHVTRPYPHGLSHVLDGAEDARAPQSLHPVFYGSFDWHSCVHGYWLLAVLLRRFPQMTAAGAIRELFDAQLVPEAIAGECAYFQRSAASGFERPYGWAWLLALQHGLRGTPWQPRLRPLSDLIAGRFHAFLPKSRYPVRAGAHFNTAFALTLAAPFAAANDAGLLGLLRSKAAEWYGGDARCQAWEPSQDDFLSPALMQAVCMKRLLPGERFAPWFAAFLPELGALRPPTLFEPAVVGDRSDGKIAHLDGLNLSRAWCWRELAETKAAAGRTRAAMLGAAERHEAASIGQIAGNFMGEHYLASFALLALWPGALGFGETA